MAKHLVLLPGLDGTGQLFSDFVAALPNTISATTVTNPAKEILPYSDLCPLVSAATPECESFVLLAESFSSPLAVGFTASKPLSLAALIICAGFVSRLVAAGESAGMALVIQSEHAAFYPRIFRYGTERTADADSRLPPSVTFSQSRSYEWSYPRGDECRRETRLSSNNGSAPIY